MKKTVKSLLCVCLVLTLCALMFAACGGLSSAPVLEYEKSEDGKSYILTYVDSYTDTDVIIPSTYKGLPVTGIGEQAFSGCDSLPSVTIPDSVTNIGSRAFESCESLTSVTIGSGVTSIGQNAFEGCDSLTSITIPKSVTSIGTGAFGACDSLTSLNVESGNTKYHSSGNCIIETTSKTLIAGCQTSVIPNDGSVTSIGKWAFFGCTSLTSITIPDSITSIGSHAISNCHSLTSITIPNSVTSIGDSALFNCKNLTSITIGSGVTEIDLSAFDRFESLTSITYLGTKDQWDAIDKSNGWAIRDCVIYFADGQTIIW